MIGWIYFPVFAFLKINYFHPEICRRTYFAKELKKCILRSNKTLIWGSHTKILAGFPWRSRGQTSAVDHPVQIHPQTWASDIVRFLTWSQECLRRRLSLTVPRNKSNFKETTATQRRTYPGTRKHHNSLWFLQKADNIPNGIISCKPLSTPHTVLNEHKRQIKRTKVAYMRRSVIFNIFRAFSLSGSGISLLFQKNKRR